jgi:hypothetical protein
MSSLSFLPDVLGCEQDKSVRDLHPPDQLKPYIINYHVDGRNRGVASGSLE